MKHELLVPAGDMECLYQAVFNGCDAVYLAGKSFGARKFANNFSDDELCDAIKFCHLYGVRIYVTMNTLVKNNEVDSFLKQAEFLHKNGVDALIVQDFGMICLLREMFPNLEIHASTQANISSVDVCKLYYKLGVKRVVFSRELSIDEIDSIDVPIEKEAFIHGAICISYSGQCLMSSMLGGRSGNRGECVGSCRMPFSLLENGKVISKNKYLLSTKELNTSYQIKRLLNSSIYSFKIEGRMKSPLYVGFITRLYRSLIDGVKIDLEMENNKLKTIYNRGFTNGRLFNVRDAELMNNDYSNHSGLPIGRVVGVNNDKIKIKLNPGEVLNQYDAIRFLNSKKGFVVNFLYDSKMKFISSSTDECYVDNKVGLEKDDIVTKTQDYLLGKEYNNLPLKKIPISISIVAKIGEKLVVEFSDSIRVVKEEGEVVRGAIRAPLSSESLKEHISKLGNTPFSVDNITVNKDSDIFISIKEINNIRRLLVDKLITEREKGSCYYLKKQVLFDTNYDNNTDIVKGVSCLVRSEEQLKECLLLGVKRIYVVGRDLYNKYKNKKEVYLVALEFSINVEEELVDRNLLTSYGLFNSYIVGGYSLGATNIYTAYYLYKIGYKIINLSVELSKEEVNSFIDEYNSKFGIIPFELMVYGRICNMKIKGNILGIDDSFSKYSLIDYKNREFPVYYDGRLTYIFNYELRDFSYSIGNKCSLRIDFYNEDSSQVKKVVKKYLEYKNNIFK